MPAVHPALEVQALLGIYQPLGPEAVAMGLLSRAWLSHTHRVTPIQTCTRKGGTARSGLFCFLILDLLYGLLNI